MNHSELPIPLRVRVGARWAWNDAAGRVARLKAVEQVEGDFERTREMDGANPAPVLAASLLRSAVEQNAERLTRDIDNGWFIRAFGAEGHFTNLDGFRDLDKLLRSPGKPVSMIELDGGLDNGSTRSRSKQPALDAKAREQIEKEIKRLREEVASADNVVEKADSQHRLDELLQQYQRDTGIGGKDRDLNNPADKLRPKIHGRLRAVRNTLKDAVPPLCDLAAHLETPNVRSEGLAFIYDPPKPAPEWDFSPVIQNLTE